MQRGHLEGKTKAMPSAITIQLGSDDVRRLPFVLTARYLYATKAGSRRKRKLFVQRADAFSTDLISLLHELQSGEITEISFRNELLGDFEVSKTADGKLTCTFAPTSATMATELQSRLAKFEK